MAQLNSAFDLSLAEAFCLNGKVTEVVFPYGEGHINDTAKIVTADSQGGRHEYILQQINCKVFRHPEQVMANISAVTDYLRQKITLEGGDPDRETMELIHTQDGGNYKRQPDGAVWRAYSFVPDSLTLQYCRSTEDFYRAALAFGTFQRRLLDYPADSLYESIPHFHDTPRRLETFRQTLACDSLGRAAAAEEEIAFVLSRAEDSHHLTDLLRQQRLPLRVTHNDTKLNNVLFDALSGDALCVVDLDTVMPGLSAYDFGDAIRFGASTAAEDETDLSLVNLDFDLYAAYCRGYLEAVGPSLTAEELRSLPWGARVITLETGIRFLTDFLDGDHYFKTSYPEHNLIRARTQFKLVRDMEAQWEDLCAVINSRLRAIPLGADN